MADDEAVAGSMIDSTILVMVRSLSAGKKFFTPLMRDSKLDDKPVGTPVSFRRSVSRDEMEENRPNKSDDAFWLDVLLMVVSCVILVVARTLQ